MARPTTEQLIEGVRTGERRALAQAITLVESRRLADQPAADALLRALAPDAAATAAHRIGVSGVPGAGKSSFLEALGGRLLGRGHRVAVLAVDPSSAVSGGSILGDKTRMATLSRSERAFVRPTAGGGHLGGTAPRTREAMLVCEAAGFDIVFVETIGVGQSEAAVRDLVDTFLLLMLTGAGDDLQGIKRGVLELADVMTVTKADGDNATRAAAAAAELRGALHILRGGAGMKIPEVTTCSAHTGDGIEATWTALRDHRSLAETSGDLARLRRDQDVAWFDRRLDEILRQRFLGQHADALRAARDAVAAGQELPTEAAYRLAVSE